MGELAEQLHWQFLKHVLGIRGSTATLIVLAEFGRYPLRFHWWQQILRYHNRINNLTDDERLIQCAFVEGLHDQAYCFWSHKIQTWLQQQSTALNIEDEICVSTVIDNAKTLYRQDFNQAGHSVGRYRQMLQSQHQDYVLAPYLSALKNFRSRRLVSRFRCGCHGLHVDTGQFKPVEEIGSCAFVLFVPLTQQKTNITLCLTALHIVQSGTGLLPFSGDQPLPCLLSSLYMTIGSLPSFCMNALHTGLCC